MEPKNSKPGVPTMVFFGVMLLVIGLTCLAIAAFIVIRFKPVMPVFLIFWGGLCCAAGGAVLAMGGKKARSSGGVIKT